MKPVTQQQKRLSSLALNGFFFIIKIITVGFFVLVATLILSQSAVAPVSSRLLSTYALEYATKTIKPYRHFFPQPYMVNLEE
ncbi:MAG: hypothetical protein IKB61_02895 [Elusimicrobiaceae bacterium]|nr:hypothetical protein [Elusimicrobiaceae bacterium]MBR5609234.1 hypothetical protein [Elusimicrobiaceae bacterium]